MVQPSSTKKRRLEALNQQQQQLRSSSSREAGGGGEAAAAAAAAAAGHSRQQNSRQQPQQHQRRPQQTQQQTQQQSHAAQLAPTHQAAPPGSSTQLEGPPQFPYQPLEDAVSHRQPPSAHIASRLQLPAASGCKGHLEDSLVQLMTPHMPLPVAQSMIAARTAADKGVVLVNPTGRVNLARPSSSSRGQRQLLAAKLLPRRSRVQLSALPKSGIDYAAMLSLHDLWCKYVERVLSARTADNFERLLQTLDWHGALLRVAGSSNPIYVHRAGIVAKSTLNTFVLVSEDGRSSIVPLKGSRFECSVECGGSLLQLALCGDNLKALKCTEQQQVPA